MVIDRDELCMAYTDPTGRFQYDRVEVTNTFSLVTITMGIAYMAQRRRIGK